MQIVANDRNFKIKRQEGRITITLEAIQMGADLCVIITGGERPHLGAVAISQTRPSLANVNQLSASTSVFALLGHKEDELARQVAHTLTTNLGKNIVVCCGIHQGGITIEEIEKINIITEKITTDLLKFFEGK